MQRSRAVLLAAALAVTACGRGDDPVQPVVPPPPPPPPPVSSFDFLAGAWSVTSRHLENGAFVETAATAVVQSSIGGRVLKERWIGMRNGRVTEVLALYGRSDRQGQWLAVRGDGERGTFDVLEGTFGAGRGVFTSRSDTRPDGGRDRVTFDSVSADRFVWKAERSQDGGSTWMTWWTMEYRRGSAGAQTLQPPDPAPGCVGEPYRGFDFWLGDWNIGSARNDIDRLLGGCIIDENWVGSETGTSFSMYDPRSDRWTQFWLDTNGNTAFIEGGLENGSMVMQSPRSNPNLRITWTPRTDGTVRQHGQVSSDGGATWSTIYDLNYVRR